MNGFETKDWILLAIAAYIAVMTLVRLMIRHRAVVSAQLARQVQEQQLRKRAEEQASKGAPAG